MERRRPSADRKLGRLCCGEKEQRTALFFNTLVINNNAYLFNSQHAGQKRLHSCLAGVVEAGRKLHLFLAGVVEAGQKLHYAHLSSHLRQIGVWHCVTCTLPPPDSEC